MPLLDVPEGGVADVELFPRGDVDGLGADGGDQLVDDPGVGEGASGHDLVVSSPGSVGVKVHLLDSFFGEVPGGGGVLGDASRGGDVVGGDGIPEAAEDVGVADVGDLGESEFRRLEEGRVVDVGRSLFPLVSLGGLGLEGVPPVGSLGNLGVDFLEHLRGQALAYNFFHIGSGGPDVLEEDWLSVGVVADGLSLEIEVDSP